MKIPTLIAVSLALASTPALAQQTKSQSEQSQREQSQREKSQREQSQREQSQREQSQREQSQRQQSQRQQSQRQKSQSQNPRVGQLAELRFEKGSAKILKNDTEENRVGHAAAWAKENPDGLIVLDGHADETGSAAQNVRLSLQRAKAVRQQLLDTGVDPEMIVIAAYGESAPRKSVPRRAVVIWGTRAGMDAVVSRTLERGHAVLWTGMKTDMDRSPQPGAVIASEPRQPRARPKQR